MVGFYSQQGVFESIKNVGNIRLALNMKAKKLVVAKNSQQHKLTLSHSNLFDVTHSLFLCNLILSFPS